MSEPNHAAELSSECWARRERIVKGFELAWSQGERPTISEFLPADVEERRLVLPELVHADLEYRLKNGQPARLETYLERFPELAGERSLMLNLIAAEYELRRRREVLEPEEYGQRFPQYREELARRLKARPEPARFPPGTPTVPQGGLHRASSLRDRSSVPGQVGNYRLLRPLGKGGMGTVYEAEEQSTGRHVALKLIAPTIAASGAAVERFRQEGRLAGMISHPRCVFVLAADEDAGQPYIVMELMPGSTLKDLVERHGPLPPQEAVAKILDVIEGLQEAHRLGVIHRDIKPSNCFLVSDGRVKVGDFGLSKSLAGSAHLTRTGSFLGTPLFASPEQIRGDPVDVRTDVYSVAATLYFLLTGQAPFQQWDPAAALARIVSDPPPPVRGLRPEVPQALDRVILRGLERQRKQRWRDLEALRRALLPFAAAPVSLTGLALRLGAFLIDFAVYLPIGLGLTWYFSGARVFGHINLGILPELLEPLPLWLFFGLQEGVWGTTLGKGWLRLRVVQAAHHEVPGFGRAMLRSFLLFGMFYAPPVLYLLAFGAEDFPGRALTVLGCHVLGYLIPASTMTAANGYRGWHEILSGTRVVRLPWLGNHTAPQHRHPDHFSLESTLTELPHKTVGSYVVLGSLPAPAGETLLVAQDTKLGRKVWLRMRPLLQPSLPESRRGLDRPTRLRWLGAGQYRDSQWDAFVAPQGSPLADLVSAREPLSWEEVRAILEPLTQELVAASADGTLPPVLTVGQVWVQDNGQVQLLDAPLGGGVPEPGGDCASADQKSLAFLGQVAALALEGKPRSTSERPAPMRAPLPGHARRLLCGLFGAAPAYQTLGVWQADLAGSASLPVAITPALRAAHLGVLSALLFPPCFIFFLRYWDWIHTPFPPLTQGLTMHVLGWPLVWTLWAFLSGGGLTLPLMGILLVRDDGRTASRLRCAWRAVLVWTPVVALVLVNLWVIEPDRAWVHQALFWSALGLLPSYLVLALFFPTRSLHDRLAGTYLVPK